MDCKSAEAKNLLLGRDIHSCEICSYYVFRMGMDYGSFFCKLPNRKKIVKKMQYKPVRHLITHKRILNHDGKCEWFQPKQR